MKASRVVCCWLAAAVLAMAGAAQARPWWRAAGDSNEGDYLPPDAAFRVGARLDGSVIRIRWAIADGYYLYRQKMQIAAESPDVTLAEPVFPAGKTKTDPYFGTQEIYLQQVEATVAYHRLDAGAHPLRIKVSYQGCATAGLCYLPMSKVLSPALAGTPAGASGHGWEAIAIGGGVVAFFFAGLVLRKGRRLDAPAA